MGHKSQDTKSETTPELLPFNAKEITMVKTSLLIPYANNARTHSEAQVKQIAASIQSFGFTNPVLVDGSNGVIAGHGRILAAELLGITEVPTICLPHLTNTAKRAYILADNRIAINSGWDVETLAVEVQRIIDDGRFDVGDLGFDAAEVDEMLASIINGAGGNPPLTDPDDVPELPTTVPISKRGDIWLCGEHRVMCGDSTDKDDVGLLMDGKRADMVFTDPPYGVSIGSKNAMLNTFQKAGRCVENIENDTLSPDDLYPILKSAFENCKAIMNDCCALYATAPQGGGLGLMMMMMKDAGLEIRHVLMWIKNCATFSMGRLDYDYQHEPIMFTWKKTHNKVMGGEHKTSCWFVDKPRESKLHPTMKPVELVVNALLNSSEVANITFDPFLGSGTTLIACQSTQRTCYGMEISPAYVDVIVNRWQNYTGLSATNAKTGLSFNDTLPDTKEASHAL